MISALEYTFFFDIINILIFFFHVLTSHSVNWFLYSYSLFNKNGLAVPMETAAKVGVIFEKILKETVKLRDEQEHDMRLEQAISMVLERHPDLKYV